MPKTITQTVYTFDELSDSAKEKARDWYREGMETWEYSEAVIEDAQSVATMLGIEFDTHDVKLVGGATRQDASVYWSGFSSQGDGASFDGRYAYKAGSLAAIKDYAPEDVELHRIAKALQDVQRKRFYKLTATCKQSGNYSHAYTMQCEVRDSDERHYSDVPADVASEVTQLLRDFANWIYRQLEAEYEYRSADEQIDESILANEYTFHEDGARVLRG